MQNKKGTTIINAFQKILHESGHKPNKIWVEFNNKSMKAWLQDNMYSIHIEGKSVVAERFIRTLKTKICKYMTSISKNVYIDKLDDIVNIISKFQVRISKCKNIFAKEYTPNWSEEVFVIKKLKILFHGHMLLVILMVKEFWKECFMKKSCKKQIKENLEQKK